MNVLVTGGLGFFGINLVRRFAEDGHYVVALDVTMPDELSDWFLRPVRQQVASSRADVTDNGWRAALGDRSFDVVVHAAATTPLAPADEQVGAERAIAVNVLGTQNVLRWATSIRPNRFLHVSSASVYGRGVGKTLGEADPHRPVNVYGITKSAGERLALRAGELSGLSVVVVRPTQLYGPMERTSGSRATLSPVHDWCMSALTEAPIEAGRADLVRDYTHVEDASEAVLQLALAPKLGNDAYNVGAGIGVTLGEVLSAVRQVFPEAEVRPGPGHLTDETSRPPVAVKRIACDTGWRPRYQIGEGVGAYARWLTQAQRVVDLRAAGGGR